eukprot:s303_g4.t1
MQPRPDTPWIRSVVYWTRDAVGVKIQTKTGGWSQKFYFSRKFNTIAVNIWLANKMIGFLRGRDASFADSQEAAQYYSMLLITAAAAHDRYEQLRVAE